MPHSHDQSEVEEEQIHFSNVITTFKNYAQYSLSANNRRRKDFFTLPKPDQDLLASLGYKAKLDQVDIAILANADFLSEVVSDPEIFGHDLGPADEADSPVDSNSSVNTHPHEDLPSGALNLDLGAIHTPMDMPIRILIHMMRLLRNRRRYKPTDFDMDKLRSTLKQFVRDWSVEVRAPLISVILVDVLLNLPGARRKRGMLQANERCTPAPLFRCSRLPKEVAFECSFLALDWEDLRTMSLDWGNEFSHYMLLSSHFILNRTSEINAHTIYPYVHSFSNVTSNETTMRPITIPDVLPSDLPDGVNFSLVAGDFEEIYGTESDANEPQSGQWDAVLTCFFIDTAKNIVNYLRIIHNILAPGGVWVNMGPLLWHWENNTTNDPSIELSLEEVKTLAHAIGFRIENERTIDTTYTNNAQGMLGYVYHAAFWTATKM
ncbi:N2227-domain-containing protein [Mycena venus]|uniref:carnosine N-methyltransferase n=1 Tax=Mycena venus TaxID=2733690 RepID=A0A8H6X708_9AGAR|nr:N2227-domain-containing protein [Mycena venus]